MTEMINSGLVAALKERRAKDDKYACARLRCLTRKLKAGEDFRHVERTRTSASIKRR
jgi:hypothetical protein